MLGQGHHLSVTVLTRDHHHTGTSTQTLCSNFSVYAAQASTIQALCISIGLDQGVKKKKNRHAAQMQCQQEYQLFKKTTSGSDSRKSKIFFSSLHLR